MASSALTTWSHCPVLECLVLEISPVWSGSRLPVYYTTSTWQFAYIQISGENARENGNFSMNQRIPRCLSCSEWNALVMCGASGLSKQATASPVYHRRHSCMHVGRVCHDVGCCPEPHLKIAVNWSKKPRTGPWLGMTGTEPGRLFIFSACRSIILLEFLWIGSESSVSGTRPGIDTHTSIPRGTAAQIFFKIIYFRTRESTSAISWSGASVHHRGTWMCRPNSGWPKTATGRTRPTIINLGVSSRINKA